MRLLISCILIIFTAGCLEKFDKTVLIVQGAVDGCRGIDWSSLQGDLERVSAKGGFCDKFTYIKRPGGLFGSDTYFGIKISSQKNTRCDVVIGKLAGKQAGYFDKKNRKQTIDLDHELKGEFDALVNGLFGASAKFVSSAEKALLLTPAEAQEEFCK